MSSVHRLTLRSRGTRQKVGAPLNLILGRHAGIVYRMRRELTDEERAEPAYGME